MSKSRGSTGGELTFIEAARRAQFTDAAIQAVAEVGFGAATVSEIAQRVGVSRGLISYHFANKDQLVAMIVQRIYATAAEVMLPAVTAEPDARAKLGAYIRANGTFITRYPRYAAALLEIWTSYRSKDGRRLDEVMADAGPPPPELADLDPARLIAAGVAAGQLRPVPVASTAVAVRQAIDGGVLLLSRDPHFDVADYLSEIAELFDRAVRPDPPRRTGRKGK